MGLTFYAGGLIALIVMLLRRARIRIGPSAGIAGTAFAVLCVVLIDSGARATLFDSFILLTACLFIAPALRITNSE
jgi:peptidoglycan/LPS O-acetylase OafA/YrhL